MKPVPLAFVVLGVAGAAVTIAGGVEQTALISVACALAIAGGCAALLRPPQRPWHSGLALAGFVFVLAKLRPWELVPHLRETPAALTVLFAIALVGAALALAAFVRPRLPVAA